MLVFGLSVIFLFIRLHGDGYDFPVEVVECEDKLEFMKTPDRTFVELSGVYHDHFRDSHINRDHTPTGDDHTGIDGDDKSKEHGQKFMGGWNPHWHLGKKKTAKSEDDMDILQGNSRDDEQWIWMTNIWHADSECGPGHLRQYRRRLDHVLASDNSSTWELMYTHKFPGPITHSSLSKRIIPETNSDVEPQETREQRGKEAIRLAVVYKIVRDEHVAYHSRVYHFGIYESSTDLKECESTSTETCHTYAPFVSFDFVLPGSTPIKDFTLEHDTILYSRMSDTAAFRTLKLPPLKPGATSPDRPYALPYGLSGPSLSCREKKSVPYRMSYLAKVPSNTESDDFHVMMGQVQEYANKWEYQLSIATEATEVVTGNKKWLTDQQWPTRQYQSLVQENDMINDEPQVYGVSVQKPYLIRSADGTSIHLPIKDAIISLETRDHSNLENVLKNMNSLDSESTQHVIELVSHHKYDRTARFQRQRPQKRKMGAEHYLIPSSNFKEQWTESHIAAGSLDTIDTDKGTVNDATDVMVLRTTRNGILILKRDRGALGFGHWRLSMIMNDEYYNPALGNMVRREVLAMKIVSVAVPAHKEIKDDAMGVYNDGDVSSSPGFQVTSEGPRPIVTATAAKEKGPGISETRIHNILLMVYGDGKVRGYDLNQATESSSFVLFLTEKYPVVIGMLAVVVAFVINEAR
ncbi:hypothetical protein BGZ54_007865 [Gamsiella multidivaricata]|nr:hypothetical protein BGZ54_007865 [Gamsiella multidivaricata]